MFSFSPRFLLQRDKQVTRVQQEARSWTITSGSKTSVVRTLTMSIKPLEQSTSVASILGSYLFSVLAKSRRESRDQIWYFFCRKDNRGERQSRKTKSGFWKKTGPTMDIFQKRGDREKIGEKRVLVFHSSCSKLKSAWVMHEYVASFLPPTDQVSKSSLDASKENMMMYKGLRWESTIRGSFFYRKIRRCIKKTLGHT
ncbi:hypothetical protein YC2023_056406 [Brassica napus]